MDDSLFPTSMGEISPEWLTGVLRSAGVLGAGRVTSIAAEAVGGSAGLMSQILRLSIAYDGAADDAPHSVIAKFPPRDAAVRATGVQLGFFEGECGFYGELARASAIRAPRCYFSRFDPATGDFVTLLEDLSAARPGDISAGCTMAEAEAAMRVLARFHASWWNSDRLADYGWLRTRAGRLADQIAMIPVAWPTFEARFRDAVAPALFGTLFKVHDVLSRSQGALAGGPSTLVHGDYKLDNLFFDPSGEIIVADWGLTMAGPPTFDVATFLGLNLSASVRRTSEIQLLHVYADALGEHGVRGYEFDASFRDYKLQLCSLLPQLIGAGGLAEFADERAIARYAAGVERVLAGVTDHGTVDDLTA